MTSPSTMDSTITMWNPNATIPFVLPHHSTNANSSCQRLRGFSNSLANFMSSRDRRNLIELLLKLSLYRFWVDPTQDLLPSGLADTLRELTTSGDEHGDDVSTAARELLDRWDKGDMSPRLLTTPLTRPDPRCNRHPATSQLTGPGPRRHRHRATSQLTGPAPGPPPPPAPAPAPFVIATPQLHSNSALVKSMMHGITKSPGKAPQLTIPVLDAGIHGHNNIPLGTWWPFLVCARRDGAHATVQAGIHGSSSEGAFSIVVSGAYEGADKDEGDEIYYSGPKAKDGAMTRGSLALVKSEETGKAVRVIRGSKSHGRWAPRKGYRYDGLYQVVGYMLVARSMGMDSFWRFRMVRLQGQEPLEAICERSPTTEECKAWELVKQM